MIGDQMADSAGRALLAKELRDLADKFDMARAICQDAAKVLQSDSDEVIRQERAFAALRKRERA